MTRDELVQLVEAAARSEGVSPEALLAIASIESAGDVNAKNSRSSASGLFQFVDDTAEEYGLTGSKRNDPTAQAYAAAKMMATNQRAMTRSLGREPSPGELYLAHQQGLAGATALLQNPDRPAAEVLARFKRSPEAAAQAVRLNGGSDGMSAGDFAAKWVNKANQRVAAIPPGSVPNTVGSQVDVQPRAVTGMPTPRSPNPANPPLPRPRPDMPVVPYEQGQTVATVETAKPQRLPPIVPNGVTYAGQERGPTTAPRKPVATPTPEQTEAATGFRLPGQSAQSAPPGGSFAGQDRGPVTQPRIALFSEVPGPSSPPKSQDRLAATDPAIVPRSGTVQPTRQQVEQGTGFRLGNGGSPLTEEVEVENPAYTALMKRVQQGEIELKGIAPSGMAMSRDARARYEASLKALEAQKQQLAGMSRTTTVTRQVAQQRAPVQQPKRAPVVQQQRPVINPANHNQAQLDAVAAGRSGYTSSSGAVLPTHSIGGKLRYTYGD